MGLGGDGLGGRVRPGGIARRAGWGRLVGSVAVPGKGWRMNPDGWGGTAGWVDWWAGMGRWEERLYSPKGCIYVRSKERAQNRVE